MLADFYGLIFFLVSQGLYCSLRQLLEEGFFHADPHPGNLVATEGGSLAYFDFGMMGDIPRHYRVGLIQMVCETVLTCSAFNSWML
jgi:aarF domain-containing kinase